MELIKSIAPVIAAGAAAVIMVLRLESPDSV